MTTKAKAAGLSPARLGTLERFIQSRYIDTGKIPGAVTVIDVRPREEYEAGHIPGALSVPVADLKRRMAQLPKRREIVAYCRGPYCVYSLEAVTLLRKHGYRARRAAEGLSDWRSLGLPLEQAESLAAARGKR